MVTADAAVAWIAGLFADEWEPLRVARAAFRTRRPASVGGWHRDASHLNSSVALVNWRRPQATTSRPIVFSRVAYISARVLGLRIQNARLHLEAKPPQFEVQAAARQPQDARRFRDVPAAAVQRALNHLPLDLFDGRRQGRRGAASPARGRRRR